MKSFHLLYLSFLLFAGILQACSPETKQTNNSVMNTATFNLRQDNPNDSADAWPHRKEMVKGLIRFHDFDIFGTQEGFKHQLDGILELGNYAYIGVGRDDGKDGGEHSAIFYKTARFEVLKQGNFWYSETPDTPGKGWDATCCNRLCTWGQFKDRETGKTFFLFNSHYDHQGRVARKESSLLLLRKIKEIAGENETVIATGDFNARPEDEPIQILASDGMLKDSYKITEQPPYGTTGTTNGFRTASAMNGRIDYIWVTSSIKVLKYGVLNEQQYGHFPSDHFPVMIQASF